MLIPIPTDTSLEELLAFLETGEAEDDSAFHTRRELEEQTGMSPHRIYRLLHAAEKRGMLRIKMVSRANIMGSAQRRPGYAFVQQAQPEEEEEDSTEPPPNKRARHELDDIRAGKTTRTALVPNTRTGHDKRGVI